MHVVIVWVLMVVSTGSSNIGNLTVVDNIATKESCEFLQEQMPVSSYKSRCVQVRKVIQK